MIGIRFGLLSEQEPEEIMNQLDSEKVSLVGNPRCEDAVVEVSVLLEVRLLKGLETVACEQGMTAGALVRCLLRDFLCYPGRGTSMRAFHNDLR